MIYTEIGIYKGRIFAIKKIKKNSIEITREMKKELKIVIIFQLLIFYSKIWVSYKNNINYFNRWKIYAMTTLMHLSVLAQNLQTFA